MLVKFSTLANGVFIEDNGTDERKPSDRCFRFDANGNGAIVNASRSILCAWKNREGMAFDAAARDEALLERFFSATASLEFLVRRSGEVTCAADVDALVSPKALKGVKHVAIVDGGAGLATTTLRRARRSSAPPTCRPKRTCSASITSASPTRGGASSRT